MRSEIARGTPLGEQIKDKVQAGGLVDDELVLALVEKEIARLSGSALAPNTTFTGVILDGFPRTLAQAKMLDQPDCPIPPIAAMMSEHTSTRTYCTRACTCARAIVRPARMHSHVALPLTAALSPLLSSALLCSPLLSSAVSVCACLATCT
jgi:hypothetical protein